MEISLFRDNLEKEAELKKIKQYDKEYIKLITSNSAKAKKEIKELIKEGLLEKPIKPKKVKKVVTTQPFKR